MNIFNRRRFRHSTTSSIVGLVDAQARLLREKFAYSRNREHKHYFSVTEVKTLGIDPCCKICGIHLSEITLATKLEKLRQQPASNQAESSRP